MCASKKVAVCKILTIRSIAAKNLRPEIKICTNQSGIFTAVAYCSVQDSVQASVVYKKLGVVIKLTEDSHVAQNAVVDTYCTVVDVIYNDIGTLDGAVSFKATMVTEHKSWYRCYFFVLFYKAQCIPF